jgi:hypothetical protein
MPNNNDVNNLIYHPQGVYFPGVKFPAGFVSNAGSGNIDIYTCPAGRRACITYIIGYNNAGTTTTFYPVIYVGGTYYRIGGQANAATTAQGQVMNTSAPTAVLIMLEAGERIGVNTTQAGMNFWANIVEFDSTAPIKSSKVVSLANGNNTIYTCPVGKKAVLIDQWMALNFTLKKVYYFNNSASSANIIWYAVPNGGSPGSTNQIATETVSSGAVSARLGGGWMLNAGDSVVCNTNVATATQTAWVNVLEL